MIELSPEEEQAIEARGRDYFLDLNIREVEENTECRNIIAGYIAGASVERIKAKDEQQAIAEHMYKLEDEITRLESLLVEKEKEIERLKLLDDFLPGKN